MKSPSRKLEPAMYNGWDDIVAPLCCDLFLAFISINLINYWYYWLFGDQAYPEFGPARL